MHSGTRGIQSTLAHLATEGGGGAQVAKIAVSTLHAVDAALSPIISHRGVTALYRRSVYLIRAEFPWMTDVYESALAPSGFDPLHSVLSQQTSPVAAAAAAALLRTFHDLLVTLIGGSLTERLLGSIWDNPSDGHAVQDISP